MGVVGKWCFSKRKTARGSAHSKKSRARGAGQGPDMGPESRVGPECRENKKKLEFRGTEAEWQDATGGVRKRRVVAGSQARYILARKPNYLLSFLSLSHFEHNV